MARWQHDDWRGWHGWHGGWHDDDWRGWRHDDYDWAGWHGGGRDGREWRPYGNWREWRHDHTEDNIYKWTGRQDWGTIRHVRDGWLIPSRLGRSRSPPPLLRRFILQQQQQQQHESASRVVTEEFLVDCDDVEHDYMGGDADDVNRHIMWLRSRYVFYGLEHEYDSQWSARHWS